jgi:hypothetical protein
MDAQIYGAYHGRFTPDRHPVNYAWSTAPDGLAWLLDMSWDEFAQFNRAALPEYLDLLSEDLDTTDVNASLLLDGGITNPALLAHVIPPPQIVGLASPTRASAHAMKEAIYHLAQPEEAWRKFLEFDDRITSTILKECQEHHIAVCSRDEGESVDQFADRVTRILGIQIRRYES